MVNGVAIIRIILIFDDVVIMAYQLKQKTIAQPISFEGIGVHSGVVVQLDLQPAPEDHGIVFQRVDLSDNNFIVASYENVVDTRLCTVLANQHNVKVATIEHLMAALSAFDITNVLVQINAEEMPIMDGSSACFVKGIEKAGVIEQQALRKVLKIIKEFEFSDGSKNIRILPADEFAVEVSIDYDHPMIGQQNYAMGNIGDFKENISNARTFGFMRDVEALQKIGLARGASLENAVALTDVGVLNPLRHADEFARHKTLDLVGDFFLAGAYIKGRISAYKPGHDLNNRALRQLFADNSAYQLLEAS